MSASSSSYLRRAVIEFNVFNSTDVDNNHNNNNDHSTTTGEEAFHYYDGGDEALIVPGFDEALPVPNATYASSLQTQASYFDSQIFWGVNAFVASMLFLACGWCCYVHHKHSGNLRIASNPQDADRRFQERLRRRHEERMAARRSTPAKRKLRLEQSFVRHQVTMVRSLCVLKLGLSLGILFLIQDLNAVVFLIFSGCQGRRYCRSG